MGERLVEDDEITTMDQFEKSDLGAGVRDVIAQRRGAVQPSVEDTPPESKAPGDKSKAKPKDEEPVVEDVGSDDDADQKGKGGSEEPPAINDTLVERAIRAGMSYTEAKSFTSESLMESVVSKLEAATAAVAGKPKDGEGEPEGEKDPLDALGDLDPEEYDPALVEQLKGIKGIVKSMREENVALKAALQTRGDSQQSTWVDGEIANLGKDFEDVFGKGNTAELGNTQQKAARDKLTRYMEFEKSEAKAAGTTLSEKDAFKLALEKGFADKIKSAKGAEAQRAAAARSRRTVSRPRDTSGRFSDAGTGSGGALTQDDRRSKAAATVRSFMVDEE